MLGLAAAGEPTLLSVIPHNAGLHRETLSRRKKREQEGGGEEEMETRQKGDKET